MSHLADVPETFMYSNPNSIGTSTLVTPKELAYTVSGSPLIGTKLLLLKPWGTLIAKAHSWIFRTLIWSWVLFWATKAAWRFCSVSRFESHSANPLWIDYCEGKFSVLFAVLVLIFSAVIGLTFAMKNRPKAAFWDLTLAHLPKTKFIVSLGASVFSVLSSLAFLPFIAFFSYCSVEWGSQVLACAFDSAGHYELAERIYSLNPKREKTSSVSVWKSSSRVEDERARVGRSAAVSRVYGPRSLEMARRYTYVGQNLKNIAAPWADVASFKSFEKAAPLFLAHDYGGYAVEPYLEMALFNPDNSPKYKHFIRQAASIPLNHATENTVWRLSLLAYMAEKSGEPLLSKGFRDKETSIKTSLANPAKTDEDISAVVTTLLLAYYLSLAATIGFGAPLFKTLFVKIASAVLHWRLSNARDFQQAVHCANGLTTLELACGNVDRAADRSASLMKMCGIDTGTANVTTSPSVRRVWFDQFHAGLAFLMFMVFLIS